MISVEIVVVVIRLKARDELADIGQLGVIVTLNCRARGETSTPRTKLLFANG
jgi:hypothetical protein